MKAEQTRHPKPGEVWQHENRNVRPLILDREAGLRDGWDGKACDRGRSEAYVAAYAEGDRLRAEKDAARANGWMVAGGKPLDTGKGSR